MVASATTSISIDSSEHVEILEDGSVVEQDDPSMISSIVTSRSVMRMTEALMDELCISVEQDLLGKDDRYEDVIRDYRKFRKEQRTSSCDESEVEVEDTLLSSSFGTFSDDEDLDSRRSEPFQRTQTKSNFQALLIGALPKWKKNSSDQVSNDNGSVVNIEPTYNTNPDANLDSVEVQSTKVFSFENSDTNDKKVSTPNAGSTFDTERENYESIHNVIGGRFRALSAEKEKVAISEVIARHTSVQNDVGKKQGRYVSFLDTASEQTDITAGTFHRFQVKDRFSKARSVSTNELLSDNLKQRRAVYLWSMSVLRKKLEDEQIGLGINQKEINALLHPANKPHTVQDYDHMIIRALSFTMKGDTVESVKNPSRDVVKSKPSFRSHFGFFMKAKQNKAKKLLKSMSLANVLPLHLTKKVENPTDEMKKTVSGRDCRNAGREWKGCLVRCTRKSLRFLKKEITTDVTYMAKQLTRRALKLHTMLSVLRMENGSDKTDEEDILLDIDLSEEDNAEYKDESVEVVQPFPNGNKPDRNLLCAQELKANSASALSKSWRMHGSNPEKTVARRGESSCTDATDLFESNYDGFEVTPLKPKEILVL